MRCVSNKVGLSVSESGCVNFSCVCFCVYTECVHVCLLVHIQLLSAVCVFACACMGSITMCAAGGLWSVSATEAPRTWLDRCVCRTSCFAEQQRAAAQCAHSGLEGDNRDIAGPLEGGGGHLGACQPFSATTKKDITITASAQ